MSSLYLLQEADGSSYERNQQIKATRAGEGAVVRGSDRQWRCENQERPDLTSICVKRKVVVRLFSFRLAAS